ncbi:IclR family transcriptional regulator domain-containing protein, partial [Pseudomonas aeruginosa]
GSVLPLLGSSTGLVFASYLPEAEFAPLRGEEAHLPGVPDAKALAAQVAEIRASGLHHVHGLLMPGVNALSAPVFAVGEHIAGVITVVGAASGFHA